MAVTVADLQAILGLDDSQFQSGMRRSSKSMEDLRQTGEQTAGRLQSSWQKLAVTLGSVFTAKKIIDFGRESVAAAAALEQSIGGTEAVFGRASKTIDEFAKTTDQSLGLSENSFRELTSQVGGMLKNMGFDVDEAAEKSIWLTEIGADLAATYGGTTREAVEALGAAFRGEADPAERFALRLHMGAVNAKAVEMGLAESTGAVDDYARAQATLALIMEQSTDAQGQFQRELGTLANKQQRLAAQSENLKAEIGEKLLPVMGALADVVGFVLGNNIALAAAGIGGLATAIVLALPKIINIRDAARDLGINFRTMGRYAKTAAGAAGIAALAVAATELGDALGRYINPDETSADLSKLENDLLHFGRSAKASGELARLTGEDFGSLAGDVRRITDPSLAQRFDHFTGKIASLGKDRQPLREARQAIDDLDKALASLAQKDPEAAAAALDAITGALEEQGVPAEKLVGLLDDYDSALASIDTQDALSDVDDLSDGLSEQERAAADAAAALDEWKSSLDAALGVQLSSFEATTRFAKSVDDLQESLTENKLTFDANTEAGRANRDALADVMQAAIRHAEAVGEETGSIEKANEVLLDNVGRLSEVMRQAGLTEDQIADLIHEMGLTPAVVETLIRLPGAATSKRDLGRLRELVHQIPGLKDVWVRVHAQVLWSQIMPAGIFASLGRKVAGLAPTGHRGGVIPGPRGQETWALVQGGERVLALDDPLHQVLSGAASASLARVPLTGGGPSVSVGGAGGGRGQVDVSLSIHGSGGLAEAFHHGVRTGDIQLAVDGVPVRVG